MRAAANPNSAAGIYDPYRGNLVPPKFAKLGVERFHYMEASDLPHPSLNVALESPSGYHAPGRVYIKIRLGDVLDQGGRIYPDADAGYQGIKPFIVTVPEGQVRFQLVD